MARVRSLRVCLVRKIRDGHVESAGISEFGKTSIELQTDCTLFKGVEGKNICWMSHNDYVSEVPEGFQTSEFLQEKGFVDFIVKRTEIKESISRIVKLLVHEYH